MSSTHVSVPDLLWRKARLSAGNGECVEVAPKETSIAVRDSKDPNGAILLYSADKWQSFVAGYKAGERIFP